MRPLTGSSSENSPSTPAAATPSGDGATATRRFRTLEDKPFFSEESSFVDDYYEGHIFSAFQVNIIIGVVIRGPDPKIYQLLSDTSSRS